MDITELLALSIEKNASDLHLAAGATPKMRVDGELRSLNQPLLDQAAVLDLVYSIMTDKQRKTFEKHWEIDFSFSIPNLGRFRTNIFQQHRGIASTIRIIPGTVPTIEALNLPPQCKQIANLSHGLVLVTGPTGSGKSTTLAAMLDHVNETRAKHILTIEDPIEFIHINKRCLINQREAGRNTKSFSRALRSALREDPDIILVGEIRDPETIHLALTAAETGHLVFASLHTNSAIGSINRILDAFPGNEKNLIRTMLAESLQAVISQVLLPKIGKGRVAALEIMLCNAAIRNLIREDKIAHIYSTIQTSRGQGMMTLDQHLERLVQDRLISQSTARSMAIQKEKFQ